MTSFIAKNLHNLQTRHYIRMARKDNYWVDFAWDKLANYQQKYGNDFCLVVNHSDTADDAYIIPVSVARQLFRDDNLDPDNRGWSATIKNGMLMHSNEHISVSAFFNSIESLFPGEVTSKEGYTESELILMGGSTAPTASELSTLICGFNEKYRSADISRRFVLSEQIARPGLISDYLKRL